MNINDYPLWTALVTPMDEKSEVDYSSLEALVKAQEDAKNGLLVLGSTGEALNLDLDEQKKVLEFVISLKPQVPIMVGVGGVNLRSTLAWVEYLEGLPIDAYLMVTPLYAKPGPVGQYEWFKTLMDKVSRPVTLYNVPSRVGRSLDYETVVRLRKHKNFWGVKEASGSVQDFAKYVEAAPEARVFSGDDSLLPAFKPLGCVGLMSVASNAWAKATHEYVRQVLEGEFDDMALWQECSDSLFEASNPVPVKRLLAELKVIKTAECRLPLSSKDLQDATSVLQADDRIKHWYKRFNQ